MNILAIDPGATQGWAFFVDNRLIMCGVRKEEHAFVPSLFITPIIVIERPQVYTSRPVDSNDLITLAILVGRLSAQYEALGLTVEHVLPHAWKGNLDKDMCWRRTKAKLSAAEVLLTEGFAKSYAHNVHDAIGIGLWRLGR